eukprot:GHVN01019353.1.p2 GENE.GHVN01019353.1~~GHVN01019353.1.p2  ORF type:complete len:395 (+),score=50.92 GHVN01019353.1:1757-2941(+)
MASDSSYFPLQQSGSNSGLKALLAIHTRAPWEQIDLKAHAKALVYTEFLRELFDEQTSQFTRCGSSVSVEWNGSGWTYSFLGFPDVLPALVNKSAVLMNEPVRARDDGSFQRVLQKLITRVEDTSSLQAIQHAEEANDVLLQNTAFSRKEVLAELKAVTPGEVERSLADLRHSYATVLMIGPNDAQQAWNLAHMFLSETGHKPLPKELAGQSLTVKVKSPILLELANPSHQDSNQAILVTYQHGAPTVAERVHHRLLGAMADRRLFDKLRTEKQLGYIVHSGMTMRGGVAEFNVMVESPNTKPHELWTILQEELKDLPDFIGKMADAEMTQWLNGVRDTIDQDDLNTIQEGNRLLDELTESGACLDMRENELHYLEKHPPTQENLRQAFKDILT